MSKKQLVNILRVEINWLNRLIDQKIMRGEKYQKLARRHKMLLLQLTKI